VREVALDPRGSWTLGLNNGAVVIVGRSEARARLDRFVRLLPQLLTQNTQQLARADLRYTNGFALTWKKSGMGNGESGIGEAPNGAPGRDTDNRITATTPLHAIPHSPFPIPGSTT
jgi:cell division protein FtsQ